MASPFNDLIIQSRGFGPLLPSGVEPPFAGRGNSAPVRLPKPSQFDAGLRAGIQQQPGLAKNFAGSLATLAGFDETGQQLIESGNADLSSAIQQNPPRVANIKDAKTPEAFMDWLTWNFGNQLPNIFTTALGGIAGLAGKSMLGAAGNVLSRTQATAAGAYGAATALNTGAMVNQLMAESERPISQQEVAEKAVVTGAGESVLDVIPVYSALKRLGLPSVGRSLLRRVVNNALVSGTQEATTEGIQAAIEQATVNLVNENRFRLRPEDADEILNSAAVGGLTGASLSSLGALVPASGYRKFDEAAETIDAEEELNSYDINRKAATLKQFAPEDSELIDTLADDEDHEGLDALTQQYGLIREQGVDESKSFDPNRKALHELFGLPLEGAEAPGRPSTGKQNAAEQRKFRANLRNLLDADSSVVEETLKGLFHNSLLVPVSDKDSVSSIFDTPNPANRSQLVNAIARSIVTGEGGPQFNAALDARIKEKANVSLAAVRDAYSNELASSDYLLLNAVAPFVNTEAKDFADEDTAATTLKGDMKAFSALIEIAMKKRRIAADVAGRMPAEFRKGVFDAQADTTADKLPSEFLTAEDYGQISLLLNDLEKTGRYNFGDDIKAAYDHLYAAFTGAGGKGERMSETTGDTEGAPETPEEDYGEPNDDGSDESGQPPGIKTTSSETQRSYMDLAEARPTAKLAALLYPRNTPEKNEAYFGKGFATKVSESEAKNPKFTYEPMSLFEAVKKTANAPVDDGTFDLVARNYLTEYRSKSPVASTVSGQLYELYRTHGAQNFLKMLQVPVRTAKPEAKLDSLTVQQFELLAKDTSHGKSKRLKDRLQYLKRDYQVPRYAAPITDTRGVEYEINMPRLVNFAVRKANNGQLVKLHSLPDIQNALFDAITSLFSIEGEPEIKFSKEQVEAFSQYLKKNPVIVYYSKVGRTQRIEHYSNVLFSSDPVSSVARVNQKMRKEAEGIVKSMEETIERLKEKRIRTAKEKFELVGKLHRLHTGIRNLGHLLNYKKLNNELKQLKGKKKPLTDKEKTRFEALQLIVSALANPYKKETARDADIADNLGMLGLLLDRLSEVKIGEQEGFSQTDWASLEHGLPEELTDALRELAGTFGASLATEKYLAANRVNTVAALLFKNFLGYLQQQNTAFVPTMQVAVDQTASQRFSDSDVDRVTESLNREFAKSFGSSSLTDVEAAGELAKPVAAPIGPSNQPARINPPARIPGADKAETKKVKKDEGKSAVKEPLPSHVNTTTPQVSFQARITRNDLKSNPSVIYVFGDNEARWGKAGQAAEMRGEPNAFGIPTKKSPYESYKDVDFDRNSKVIAKAFDELNKLVQDGKQVVFPADGLGTGLAKLSPKYLDFINGRIRGLISAANKGQHGFALESKWPTFGKLSVADKVAKPAKVDTTPSILGWRRYPPADTPSYEVSTKGDSRFSALKAKLQDGRTIEEAYQLDVKGYRAQGSDWHLGKRKPPLNGKSREQLYEEYKALWRQWVKENPELFAELKAKAAGHVLTDKHATSEISQARALFELATEESSKPKNRTTVTKVISGGQTGGDFGALRGAKDAGVETGGTAPGGWRTAEGSNPELAKFGLVEHAESDYVPRTIKNIDDADATVAFLWGPSVGTTKTIGYAQTGRWIPGSTTQIKGAHRPILVIRTKNVAEAVKQLTEFLDTTKAKTLNVAGHRESSQPGIQNFVRSVISEVLGGAVDSAKTDTTANHFDYVGMSFSYEGKKNADVKSDTTFDAILAGERTATTRFDYFKDWNRWYDSETERPRVKAGDTITFVNGKTGAQRASVTVKVTDVSMIPQGKDRLAYDWGGWSKREGWTVAAGLKFAGTAKAVHIRFEVVQGSQTKVAPRVVAQDDPLSSTAVVAGKGVEFEGAYYRSVLHAFIAAKTLDKNTRRIIKGSKSADDVASLSQTLQPRKDWQEIKKPLMLELLRQKFSVPHFKKLLLDTGSQQLVDPDSEPVKGVAKMLMQLRDEMKGDVDESRSFDPELLKEKKHVASIKTLEAHEKAWLKELGALFKLKIKYAPMASVLKMDPGNAIYHKLMVTHNNGVLITGKDGTFTVGVSPFDNNKYRRQEYLLHEIGHAIMRTHYDAASTKTKQALDKAFNAWVKKYGTSGALKAALASRKGPAELARFLTSDTAETKIEDMSSDMRDYLNLQKEWFADNVMRYLLTRNPVAPRTLTESFFRGVAETIRKLFNFLLGKNMTAHKSVESFMDNLLKSDVDNAARLREIAKKFHVPDNIMQLVPEFDATLRRVPSTVIAGPKAPEAKKEQITAAILTAFNFSDTSTTHSLTEFFAEALTRDNYKALVSAFKAPYLHHQLLEAFKDSPEALAKLDNIHVRIALGYQLWAMGKLELGPKTLNLFTRANKWFNEVTGVMMSHEKATEIFKAIKDGQVDAHLNRAGYFGTVKAVRDTKLKNILGAVRDYIDDLNPVLSVLAGTEARILATNNAALIEVANLFNHQTGRKVKGAPYLQDKNRIISRYVDKIRDLVADLSEKDQQTLLSYMIKNRGSVDPNQKPLPAKLQKRVTKLRSMFQQLFQYGSPFVPSPGELHKVENYFPIVFDGDALANKSSALINMLLQKHYRSYFISKHNESMQPEMKRIEAEIREVKDALNMTEEERTTALDLLYVKQGNLLLPTNDKAYDGPDSDVYLSKLEAYTRNSAIGLISALQESDGVDLGRSKENMDTQFEMPFASMMQSSSFQGILDLATPKDKELIDSLMDRNLNHTLINYVKELVKYVEYVKRVGERHEVLQRLFSKAEKLGATPDELELTKDYINAIMGRHGRRTNKAIHEALGIKAPLDEREVIKPVLQKTFGVLMTVQNMALLSLATLASLLDPIGIAIRSSSSGVMARGLNKAVASVIRSAGGKKDKLHALAESLGVIEDRFIQEALNWEYGSAWMTDTTKAINDWFFKVIGLTEWTKFTRLAAVQGSIEFLKQHYKGETEESRRYLRELGLHEGDIKFDNDGNLVLMSAAVRDKLKAEYDEEISKLKTLQLNHEAMETTKSMAERAKDSEGVAKADAELKKLSAEIKDSKAKAAKKSTKLSVNVRTQNAIIQFTDEAILRPNPAQRPLFGSDPHFMLVMHLKSYMYGFHDRILRRVWHELQFNNQWPLVYLASYVPAMMFINAMRRGIVSALGDDDEDKYGTDTNVNDQLTSDIFYASERTGLFGLGQMAIDGARDVAFGKMPYTSMLGPTYDNLIRRLPDLARGDTQVLIDNLPFQNSLLKLVTE